MNDLPQSLQNPNYKGSAFVTPSDRRKWEKIVLTDAMVSRKDKKEGARILQEALEREGISPFLVKKIVAHEKRHARVDKEPGVFGICKNKEGHVTGAFYRPVGGERTDEEIVDITAAGNELFTRHGEGDTGVWMHAQKRIWDREGR